MADFASLLNSLGNKYSSDRYQDWRRTCIAKFYSLGAHGIVMGTDAPPVITSPTPTESEASRLERFNDRKSKALGYILDTLDDVGYAVIETVTPGDLKETWDKLVDANELKDAGSRMFATQNLLTMRKGDVGHESESYTSYGNCCIHTANILRNMLPSAPKHPSNPTTALTPGFTVANLVDELAIGIIVIGLGFDEANKQLKHTLTHMNIATVAQVIGELQKADNLVKSDNLASGSTPDAASALAAKGKSAKSASGSRDVPKFTCTVHKKNFTHDTKDCNTLKTEREEAAKRDREARERRAKKAGKTAKRAEASSDDDEGSETENLAHVAHLASPPRRRRPDSHADTRWNADSGATAHMTPH